MLVFKVGKLYVIVLILLIFGLVGSPSLLPQGIVYGAGGVQESIRIFTAYDSILVRVSLNDAPEVYQSFIDLFGSLDPSISSLKISFVKNSRWRNSYTYFLDGVWYNDTGIEYVPGTRSEMVIVSDASPDDLSGSVSGISEAFMLAFNYYYTDDDGAIHYISPYSDIVFESKLYSFIDNLGYAVAKWTPVTRLSSFDYYNITIVINRSSETGALEVSYINFNSGGFRTLMGQVDWEPYSNDTNNVELSIYSRYIILYNIPDYYDLVVLDPAEKYIKIEVSLSPELEDNPLDVSMKIDYPILLISRDFNSTDFSPGSYIEVFIKVENIGPLTIDSVSVRESNWWLGSGVEFVSGDTEANISDLGSGDSKIIKYVVKVGNLTRDIYIGPAEARVVLPTNITMVYFSQANYIHRGGAFIDSMLKVHSLSAEFGSELTYKVIVRNRGNSTITNLVVGEYVIGSLDPGEERIVEFPLSPSSPHDVVMSVGGAVQYSFNGSQYSLSTPTSYVVFIPSDIYAPSFNASIKYVETDNILNISLTVKNVGLVDAIDMSITGDLSYLSGILDYVDGDFSLSGSRIFVKGLALGVGDSLELSAEFEIKTDRSFIYPVFEVTVLEASPSLKLVFDTDIFYNKSLDVVVATSGGRMITRYPFYVNISIYNNVGFSVYNYTVFIGTYPDGISVEYLNNNISVIAGGESAEIPIAVRSEDAGEYYLRDIRASFILGGVLREHRFGGVNITFVYGLRVVSELVPSNIDEGGEAHLLLRFSSDCAECLGDVKLVISLPEGIVFENGARESSEDIVLEVGAAEKLFIIKGLEPGEYIINISISYVFDDRYPVFVGGDDIGVIKLNVEENLLMRYYIYFFIGLIIAVVVAFILRRIG